METIITVPSADQRKLITDRTSGSVQFDPETFEPYMQLSAPFEHIRLTAPRESDVPTQMEIMNDLNVNRTLMGIPYPYSTHNAERWVFNFQKTTKAFLASFEEGGEPFDGVPLCIIRDYSVDKSGALIGETGKWDKELGISLRASHWRKGIASAVIGYIIQEWIIPHTNHQTLEAEFFISNTGSKRTWEKNGFVIVEVEGPRSMAKIPEAKGGGEEPEARAIWTRPSKE